MSRRAASAGVALAVVIAIAGIFAATPWGFGVTTDSVIYLHAAESPIQTQFPPLYAAAIALTSALGPDPQSSARRLAALIAAANVLVVYFSALLVAQNRTAATLAALFISVSLEMLFLNTAVLADALFIFFTMVALYSLTRYLGAGGLRFLVAAATATALSCMTRYAGAALILAGVSSILIFGRRRAADASVFAGIAAVPALLWFAGNTAVFGRWSDDLRPPSLALPGHLAALVETICSWLLPGSNRISVLPWQSVVLALSTFAICGGTMVAFARAPRRPFVPVVFLVFPIAYVAFMLVTAAFVPEIPMDNRILAPAYVAMVIVATFVLHSIPARRATAAFVAAVLLLNVVATAGAIRYFRREGRGFVGPCWDYPELRRTLSGIVPTAVILSNYPAAIDFRLGRTAMYIRPNGLASTVAREGEAILVYFDDARRYAPRHPQAMKGQPTSAEDRIALVRGFDATVLAHERNGWIYRLRR